MNKIVYDVIDGCPQSYDIVGNTYISKYENIFGANLIELETDKTLSVGDRINYKRYTTKVCERIYHPETGEFEFLCYNIYTYRKE
jgi:hypothetical protein